ncbi:MAG: hypothetical protein JSV17_05480 [Candidatus Aminicenantes bacterium]|nr:MAG: hypothetical protein JSV17_05480 [Candidatus Aminicenantes bacterium]
MAHLIIGAILTAVFISLILHARKKHLRITWWQWMLTVLGLLYAGFVLEVIVSFLEEGAERAALVMGLFLGFIAIVWAVLLGRFVFAHKTKS